MDLNVLDTLGAGLSAYSPYAPSLNSGANFAQLLSGGETGYDGLFQAAAEAYQLPVDLLKSVAKAESAFTADAVSPCGAQGIMQLMPGTARALGVADAFDPAQNIMGGAKYLRQMVDRFDGDLTKAVAAYNAGPGAVEQYGGVPPYRETQNYVQKVLGAVGGAGALPVFPLSSPSGAFGSDAVSFSALSALNGASSGASLASAIQQVLKNSGTLSEDSVRMYLGQFLRNEDDQDEEPMI